MTTNAPRTPQTPAPTSTSIPGAAVEQVDAIIIGSGQAGNPLAVALSKAGKKTIIIEQRYVGGTCVNTGCTPTKTMISSAKVASLANRAAEFGIKVSDISADMTAVRARKRDMVELWRKGSEKSLKEAEHVELVRGIGRFSSPNSVEVRLTEGGRRSFSAGLIFINTGLSSITPGRRRHRKRALPHQ